MKFKQIFALLCVAILSLSIMCSCGKKDKKNNDTTTTTTQQTTEEKTTQEDTPADATIVNDENTDKDKPKKNLRKTGSSKKRSSKKSNSSKKRTSKRTSTNRKSSSTNSSQKSSGSSSSKTPSHTHKYVGGICSCGKADKSHPYLALLTLIKNNEGTRINDKDFVGYGIGIEDVVDKDSYYIMCNDKADEIGLVAIANENEPYDGVGILISKNSSNIEITCIDKEGAEYSCNVNKSSYTAYTDINLNTFTGTKEEKAEIKEFTEVYSACCMSVLNEFLTSTNCGLTLKDFGLNSYIAINLG